MLHDILIVLGAVILNCLFVWVATPWVFRRWHSARRDVSADGWEEALGDALSRQVPGAAADRRRAERRRIGSERRGEDRRKLRAGKGAFGMR